MLNQLHVRLRCHSLNALRSSCYYVPSREASGSCNAHASSAFISVRSALGLTGHSLQSFKARRSVTASNQRSDSDGPGNEPGISPTGIALAVTGEHACSDGYYSFIQRRVLGKRLSFATRSSVAEGLTLHQPHATPSCSVGRQCSSYYCPDWIQGRYL